MCLSVRRQVCREKEANDRKSFDHLGRGRK